jgi:hypothetical protein
MKFWVGTAIGSSFLTFCGCYVGASYLGPGEFNGRALGVKPVSRTIDPSDPALKGIDQQLKVVAKGLQDQMGTVLQDGSTIRSATLDGRTIRVNIQMPFDKYHLNFQPSLAERKRYLQKQFCTGDTRKMFNYGVSWSYVYYDKAGIPVATMIVDSCDA